MTKLKLNNKIEHLTKIIEIQKKQIGALNDNQKGLIEAVKGLVKISNNMNEQFQEMQIQLDQMTDEEVFDKELKEEGKIK